MTHTITFDEDFDYATIDGADHRIDWFDVDPNNFVNKVVLTDGRTFTTTTPGADDAEWTQA